MTAIVNVPVIPTVPPFPALGSPSFNTEAYAFGTAMPGVASGINDVAETAKTNATAAKEQAEAAVVSRDIAVAAVNYQGAWATLTGALAKGATVSHVDRVWMATENLANVALVEPGTDIKWLPLTSDAPPPSILASPLLVNTTKAVSFAADAAFGADVNQAITLDADRELLVLVTTTDLYVCVYNKTTDTMGATSLIYSGGGIKYAAALTGTDQVLLVMAINGSTNLRSVVLTLSGTSVSVGTPTNTTLSGILNTGYGFPSLIKGAGLVIGYGRAPGVTAVRAITVSGGAITVGSEVSTGAAQAAEVTLVDVDSTRLLAMCNIANVMRVVPFTMSGASLTAGTSATVATTSASSVLYGGQFSSGRYAAFYTAASNSQLTGAVITLTGTVATMSTVVLIASGYVGLTTPTIIKGDSAAIVFATKANVFTDSSGTATAGSEVTLPGSGAISVDSESIAVRADNSMYTIGLLGSAITFAPYPAFGGGGDAMPTGTPAPLFQTATAVYGLSPKQLTMRITASGATLHSAKDYGMPVSRITSSIVWQAAIISARNYQFTRLTLP